MEPEGLDKTLDAEDAAEHEAERCGRDARGDEQARDRHSALQSEPEREEHHPLPDVAEHVPE